MAMVKIPTAVPRSANLWAAMLMARLDEGKIAVKIKPARRTMPITPSALPALSCSCLLVNTPPIPCEHNA